LAPATTDELCRAFVRSPSSLQAARILTNTSAAAAQWKCMYNTEAESECWPYKSSKGLCIQRGGAIES